MKLFFKQRKCANYILEYFLEILSEISWQVFPLKNYSYLSFLISPCALSIMRYGKERYSVTAGTFVFTSAGAIIVVWGILSCYVDEIIFCFKKKIDSARDILVCKRTCLFCSCKKLLLLSSGITESKHPNKTTEKSKSKNAFLKMYD